MKGWVYVITNKAMPDLVKIGFSTKDPALRAAELNHTGSPHPYMVEYEILIDEPYVVEQKAHKLLSAKREAKEWFRCGSEEAVAAIKQIAGSGIIIENYKGAERSKAEALHQQRKREAEALHQQEKRESEAKLRQQQADDAAEKRMAEEEAAIRKAYQHRLSVEFAPRPFWQYWAGGAALAFFCVAIALPKASEAGLFMLTAFIGAILGWLLQEHYEGRKTKSSAYLALAKQHETDLRAVRFRVVSCPNCSKKLQFDRAKLLGSCSSLVWNCPSCKSLISPPI